MAVYFLDSSALVKRYIRETGTGWIIDRTHPAAGNSLYIARITGVEMISAITRRVRRGDILAEDAAKAIADFREDFHTAYLRIEITAYIIDQAMMLAQTHSLRGYDAVQLAASLQVRSASATLGLAGPIFVTADNGLLAAAMAEGLSCENPNTH